MERAALHFSHRHPPAPGTAVELAPGVLWLRMALPFALDHINLWLLREGGGWCAVDCGYGTDATQAAWEQVLGDALGGAPLTRVIVTHYHPDHVGCAAWLAQRCGVQVWMPEAEYLTAHAVRDGAAGWDLPRAEAFFGAHGLPAEHLRAVGTRLAAYHRGVPDLPRSYRRIVDGERITVGEHAWQVVTLRGHSPEHAALWCEQLRLLISGDQVLPRITTNVSVPPNQPEADPLGLYLESLDRIAELPADILVLPSHGHPFTGLHQRLEQLRAHHAECLDALLGACDAPRTAHDLLPVLFRRELDAHQLIFGMAEAVAHLNHLLYQGALAGMAEGALLRFARARQ